MFYITDSRIFGDFKLKPMAVPIVLEDPKVHFIKPEQLGLSYIILKESKLFREQLLKVIKLYEAGIIKLFYDPTYPNIAPFIPYESTKIRGQFHVAINIKHHVEARDVSEDIRGGVSVAKFNISVDRLRGLLFAGAAVLASATSDGFRHVAMARDQQILFMSHMWLNALSNVSSMASNPSAASHFRYVFARWICAHQYQITDSDMIIGIARKISSLRDYEKANAFNLKVTDEELRGHDAESFIREVLRREFPQLSKLDIETVRHGFVNMGTINTMCIDYIPYVTAALMSYQTGFVIYNNRILKTELKQPARDAMISTLQSYDKKLDYLISGII